MAKHRIISIEPFILQDKLSDPFYFSQYEYKERKICIVKITTEDGIVGWGEGYGPALLVKAGIEYLSAQIMHQPALHHENIWKDMYRISYDFARKGVLLSAISAIDIALWDIKGKILDQPVSVLLGGRKRERVKLYATGLYFTRGGNMQEKLVSEALHYQDNGFSAVKMKVGLGVKKDLENIIAVREALSPDVGLMIDANHAYNLLEAKKLVSSLKDMQIGWFEEPISNEDYDGYAALRSMSPVPIAGGECEYLIYGAHEMLSRKCVDIFQPDTGACGGITEMKKIMALAEAHFIQLTPHNWGTGIAFAANLHVVSNLDMIPGRMFPEEPLLELDCSPNRLREELLQINPHVESGYAQVPDRPGLGIEINDNKITELMFADQLFEK